MGISAEQLVLIVEDEGEIDEAFRFELMLVELRVVEADAST